MTTSTWHWSGSGWFSVAAVGCSYYRDHITAVAQNPPNRPALVALAVQLVPTRNNPADPNAVALMFEGRMLGHLPRDFAPTVRAAMLAQAGSLLTTTADAMISGGLVAPERQFEYRIELDLQEPLELSRTTPPNYPEPIRINGYATPTPQPDGSFLAQVWVPYPAHDQIHSQRKVAVFVPRGTDVVVCFLANRQGVGMGEKIFEMAGSVARECFGAALPHASLEGLNRRFAKLRLRRAGTS